MTSLWVVYAHDIYNANIWRNIKNFLEKYGDGFVNTTLYDDATYLVILHSDWERIRNGEIDLVGVGGVRLGSRRTPSKIVQIVIHPAWRGQGIGKKFTELLIRYALEHSNEVELWVRKNNERMIHIVESLGLVRAGENERSYKYIASKNPLTLKIRELIERFSTIL